MIQSLATARYRSTLVVWLLLAMAAVGGVLVSSDHLPYLLPPALVVFAFLGLLAALHNIQWAILITFIGLAVVAWEPAPFDVVVPFLAAIVLLSRVTPNVARPPTKWFLTLLAIFATGQIVSALVSPFPVMSLRWSAISLLLCVVGWLAYAIGTHPTLLQCALVGYVIGATITTVVGLLTLVGLLNVEITLKSGIRLRGFYQGANVFAPYLVLAILLLISFPFDGARTGRLLRRWRPLMLLILTSGVLFSYSRGAWAYLALALVIYGALRSLRSPTVIPRLLLVGIVATPCILLAVTFVHLDENSFLASRLGLQSYDQQRFATRDRSLSEFPSSPLVGHGGGMTTAIWHYDPHNVYSRLLYENGLVGFISVVTLIAVAVVTSITAAFSAGDEKKRRLAAAFAAALIGVAVESMVIDTLHWRNLWLLIGWCWATGAWIPREIISPIRPALTPIEPNARRAYGSGLARIR